MSLSLMFVVIIACVWCLVIGEISLRQFVPGLLFGTLFWMVTGAGRDKRIPLSQLPRRIFYFAVYVLVLIPYDIIRSNLDLARRLLRRTPDIHPGIIRLHIGDLPQTAGALVAHSITMTPGEIVVDYSEDGDTVYIHMIDTRDVEAKRASFWNKYHSVVSKVFS